MADRVANMLMIAGLALLMVAIGAAFLLITDMLFDGARVWIYTAAICLTILGLWFGRPLLRQVRGLSSGP